MYPVEQPQPSTEFESAWLAAARHLQRCADTNFMWLRSALYTPFAEHLSFRIGNQIYFVFVEAAEFKYRAENELFKYVCKNTNAIPLLLPMQKRFSDWKPQYTGWGFIHIDTGKAINPLDYVSDELIEMTDWELHDLAVQVVCTEIEKEGKRIFSKQPSPEINPSIWFEEDGKPYFVIVRAARHPESEIPIPSDIEAMKQSVEKISDSGYFAPVIVADANDPFDKDAKQNGNILPLYRGYKLDANYSGLVRV